MIDLYSPNNEPELALIKGILDAECINFDVRNDHFGSLFVGPQIELYNKKMIVVQDDQYEKAKELLSDYLNNIHNNREEINEEYSLYDRLRMAFEVMLFGWIMPGKKKRDKNNE